MRRTDSQWLALDSGADSLTGLSKPGGCWPQSEQPYAGNLHGDFTEGCSPHWENAWIDLGGEG